MYTWTEQIDNSPVPLLNRFPLKRLTVDCGVDILSFGGTKNGLMMGECVIVFNKDLQPEARFIRKQSAQLASKMRYLLPVYGIPHR